MPGLLGKKIGMTQLYIKGVMVPVTVIQAGPCVVVEKRNNEKNGYQAIQLGFDEVTGKKRAHQSKPYNGHFLKKGLPVFKWIKEFRTTSPDSYKVGSALKVDLFEAGDIVHIEGESKGKGFQGVMKRHHFGGMNASHGVSISHRAPGSIGQRTYPGKVFKNKKMAGRMGGKAVTVKNLEVVDVKLEQNLLILKGAIPGPKNSFVVVNSKTKNFEDRALKSMQGAA